MPTLEIEKFFHRAEKLDTLLQQTYEETKETPEVGFGFNLSKICFLFKDKNEWLQSKTIIEELLKEQNLNSWDIWITFVHKVSSSTASYKFLYKEMAELKPTVLFFFEDSIEEVKEHISHIGNAVTPKIVEYVSSNDLEQENIETLEAQFKKLGVNK